MVSLRLPALAAVLGLIVAAGFLPAASSAGASTPTFANTLVLTEAGKGHQHQTTWVALVRNK